MVERIAVVEESVAYFKGQLARVVHGIARIDGEIEDRILDLSGIDECIPQAGGNNCLDLDGFAQAAPQHVFHAGDQPSDPDRLRLERLPAAEGQQLARQFRAAAYAGERRSEEHTS